MAKLWIGLVIFVVVATAAKFSGAVSLEAQRHLATAYLVGVLGTVAALGLSKRFRLVGYLKQSHPDVWRRVKNFPGVGPGAVNDFSAAKWLYSSTPESDEALEALKQDLRRFFVFALVAIFSVPVVHLMLS